MAMHSTHSPTHPEHGDVCRPLSRRLTVVACALVVAVASVVARAWADPESPQLLSHVVAKLNQLHRVTERPHFMEDSTAALCVLTFNP